MMLQETVWKTRDKCINVASRLSDDKTVIRSLARKLQRWWEKRLKLDKSEDKTEIEEWRKEAFHIDDSESEKNIGGRPSKRLCEDMTLKTRNKILDDFLSQIAEIADQEGVSPSELLNQLNERSKLKWKTDVALPKPVVSVENACALIYNVNFSLSQYQQLRTFLKDHSIDIPIRNEIDSYKKSLMCEYFVEATKTFCHFETLVTDTLQSLMMLDTHNVQPNEFTLTVNSALMDQDLIKSDINWLKRM